MWREGCALSGLATESGCSPFGRNRPIRLHLREARLHLTTGNNYQSTVAGLRMEKYCQCRDSEAERMPTRKKGGRKQEREEGGCNFFPFSFATANEQLLPAVLGPCPLFPLGTTNPDHGSLWRNGITVKSRSNKMTWASFPQVSQPGQACVCPPASTVDSRHSHTRDDLISYPLPSAADSLSFLPRTISAYVCEKVANEVRRSRRRREQSDRRSTEGDRAGCKTRPHHLAPSG